MSASAVPVSLRCPKCQELWRSHGQAVMRPLCETCGHSWLPFGLQPFPVIGVEPHFQQQDTPGFHTARLYWRWSEEAVGWWVFHSDRKRNWIGPHATLEEAARAAMGYLLMGINGHGAPRGTVLPLLDENTWCMSKSLELVAVMQHDRFFDSRQAMVQVAANDIAGDSAVYCERLDRIEGWTWRERHDPTDSALAVRDNVDRRVWNGRYPESLKIEVSEVQRIRRQRDITLTGVVVTIEYVGRVQDHLASELPLGVTLGAELEPWVIIFSSEQEDQ